MGFFTILTTNVRAKRAGVVLYALILFSLSVVGNTFFPPGIRDRLFWATLTIGFLALYVVAQVSRGRLDGRLTQVSVWLAAANVAILAFYAAVYWRQLHGAMG
ncbi:MAG: hypothetical protein HYY17_09655 [Planctomycetes bacterium]|nr:hypothetical protein [Planctomycetota bacterium]